MSNTSHRFRKSLEPSINPPVKSDSAVPLRPYLKASGNLLIGFSGGVGSSVLLDLVHESYFVPERPVVATKGTRAGTIQSKRSEVWKKAAVVYVELAEAFEGVSFLFIPLSILEHTPNIKD